MHILMFAKQKGGVGASTLAREIGTLAAAGGERVVFVDLDPQASLSKWWNRRTAGATEPPNPALAATRPDQLLGVLNHLRAADAADLVVVDVPPSVHGFLLGVMQTADVILIPVRPTADDFEALPDIVDMVERAGRRYAFVLTQAPTGKRIRAVEEAIPILARQGRIAGGGALPRRLPGRRRGRADGDRIRARRPRGRRNGRALGLCRRRVAQAEPAAAAQPLGGGVNPTRRIEMAEQ